MAKYFGTDGFRGEANVDLTAIHAFKIGRFLGWYYGRAHKCKIVIGKDTRRSSYMFEAALTAGITAAGGDAYSLHVTTTPSVAYVTRTEDFDCGIMISASHNAYQDNGLKLINGMGEKMEDSVLAEVEAFLDGPDDAVPYATGVSIGSVIDHAAGRNRYIGYLISLATKTFRGMKVGLDCANGSTWQIAKSVFDALGADTHVINNRPSGVNINKACGSTCTSHLCAFVRDAELDVGFAFDGDADRCIAVDETGEVIDGDRILYLCALSMKERGKLGGTKVVTTVMSNLGLYRALDEAGIGYETTAVGDKYVYENMAENGHMLGGEQSGHIIFRKHATTGDGLITAIKIMQAMLEKKLPLSALVAPVTIYPQVLKNVVVTSKDDAMENPAVLAAVRDAERALGDTGRILLRKSGTEPLLRVMTEAPTLSQCEAYADSVIDAMRGQGLLVTVK